LEGPNEAGEIEETPELARLLPHCIEDLFIKERHPAVLSRNTWLCLDLSAQIFFVKTVNAKKPLPCKFQPWCN